MKSEDIMEALGEISPDLVEESRPRQKRTASLWLKWAVPAAAVLVIALGLGIFFSGGPAPGEPAFPVATLGTGEQTVAPTSTAQITEPTVPVTEPGETVTDPVTPMTDPAPTVTDPLITVTNPAPTVTDPVITVTDPAPTATDPATAVTRPVTTGTDPATRTVLPSTAATRYVEPTSPPPPPLEEQPELLERMSLAKAVYPQTVQYPTAKPYTEEFNRQYKEWQESLAAKAAFRGYGRRVTAFFKDTVPAFLTDNGGYNRVYSPLNVYMALAMLAETSAGNTQKQVLDLLDVSSAEELREQVYNLWNVTYRDDGVGTRILANSLWLRDGNAYHMDTVEILKEKYYASTFRGAPGTAAFDGALQTWINQQTGGLLKDQVGAFRSNPNTEFLLASTLYFKESWAGKFQRTEPGVFHGTGGDTDVTMMKTTQNEGYYYLGERFSAVRKEYSTDSRMTFLLPDEGITPEQLLRDPEALSFLTSGTWMNQKILNIHLTVPKFDVVSDLNLAEQLQSLGITDCFDAGKADFSPLTDTNALYVNRVLHAARVKVDEEGTEAAAYTIIDVPYKWLPQKLEEIEFTLDRPFIFLITGSENVPLFIGIVNQV